ncbi:MAG: NADP-dependent oxidoreductase [Candidatus Eremiobacteraeota bacterium]|nr:NADP-dependent oxidoreductase [Candidatus Eremiobacteraeota bacterium]MBV8459320.1 NADP-dependent oxidoreductase [Candidatus Eremiobacteraeota bacterium]
MKAIVVEHRGDPGALVDIAVPEPGENEIVVRVAFAGVNPIDWKRLDRDEQPVPFVMGQDFAGAVSAVGRRVTKYHEGDRVCGIARTHGAFAQYTVVPEDIQGQPVAAIPDAVGDADAAALPTAGLTALASIDWLQVGSETSLVVLGATGGVGGFAVQIARTRGARVIGSGGSAGKAEALSLGIDTFIAYDRENVPEAIRTAAPGGVDCVLDLVDHAEAIKAMAPLMRSGGRIVSTIGAADAGWFDQNKLTALNLIMLDSPQASNAGLRELLGLVEQGRISTRIVSKTPLTQAVSALDESRRGTVSGKLVIELR